MDFSADSADFCAGLVLGPIQSRVIVLKRLSWEWESGEIVYRSRRLAAILSELTEAIRRLA
jgi:hypothetical protein